MDKINEKNIWLVVRTAIIVAIIIVVKWICIQNHYELLGFNSLFSAIVAANVFLMGFLLSGVMTDYKESEKIPGEMAAILYGLYDEFYFQNKHKENAICKEGMERVKKCSNTLENWFFEKTSTDVLLHQVSGFYEVLYEYEKISQVSYVMRLKNELSALKKLIIRAETIRDTSFIKSGYVIAMITTVLLCIGLEFSHIGRVLESLFVVGAISFLMVFLLQLIHDLDNPFAYKQKFSAENISLHPLNRLKGCMEENHWE